MPGRRSAASPAPTSTARAAWPGAPRRRSRPTASARATTTSCSTASTTTRPGCRRSCIFPSVDALDEFKLQTSTYSAEFGRSLGGVVNLQIKSGTNQFRGSAFEFLRNDAFDANNFFNNRAGRAKPDFKQNQFGGTFGGPVFRDKTFFFGDYQGHRETQGQTFLSTVPTMKMRQRGFLGDRHGRSTIRPRGQPFAGNIIPQQPHRPGREQHPRAALSRSRTPPGRAQSNGQVINNYLINPIKERQDNQGDVKVDHNLSSAQSLLRALQLREDASAAAGLAAARRRRVHLRRRRRQHQGAEPGVQRHAHVISSRWLNEFRFGWSLDQVLHDADRLPHESGQTPWASRHQPERRHVGDDADWSSRTSRNLGANSNQPLITNQNDFQIFDNVTRSQRQAHDEGRRQPDAALARDPQRRHDRRQLLLQQQHDVELRRVSRPAAPSNSNTGFDVASFMLGFVGAKNRNAVRRGHLHREAARVRGLLPGRLAADEQADGQCSVCGGTSIRRGWRSTIASRTSTSRPGKFIVASDDASLGGVDVGRYLQTYSKGNFGPRFGFAYDLTRGRQEPDSRRLRRVLELLARRHLLVEGAEPAVPAVDVADADANVLRRQPAAVKTACRRRREWIPTGRRGRNPIDLRREFPRRLRAAMEHQRPAQPRHGTTWSRRRTSGPRGVRWSSRWTSTRRRRSSA